MWQTISASPATHLSPHAKPIPLRPTVVQTLAGAEVTLPTLRDDGRTDYKAAAQGRHASFIGKLRGLVKDLTEVKDARKNGTDTKKREAALAAVNRVIGAEMMTETNNLDSAELCLLGTIAEAIGDRLSELAVNHLVRSLLSHANSGHLAQELAAECGVAPPPPLPTQPEVKFAPGSVVQSPFAPAPRLGF